MAASDAPPLSRRERLLPRSVLGLSAFILAISLGAAFSGTILYAYYQYRLDQNEDRIDEYVRTFDERLDTAKKIIEKEQEEAKAAVRAELEPLEKIAASGETLEQLLRKVSPSIYFVETVDEGGAPSVGTAFVVFSDAEQSFLLTSFNTIRAATRQPGPGITLRKGDERLEATLFTWADGRDLALLTVNRGNLERLTWVTGDPPVRVGDRVFGVSGLGGAGGSVSQGFVGDVSQSGIQHDAPVGVQFQGGPLLNSNGEVIAVASRIYSPLGFAPDAVYFGVPIRDACLEGLRCPEGDAASGAQNGG